MKFEDDNYNVVEKLKKSKTKFPIALKLLKAKRQEFCKEYQRYRMTRVFTPLGNDYRYEQMAYWKNKILKVEKEIKALEGKG